MTNVNELSGEHKVAMSSLYGESTQTPSIYNPETGEIISTDLPSTDTTDYKVVQQADGTFKKSMKYHQYFSRRPQNNKEKIELYKVFNDSNSNLVTPLKNMIEKPISIAHVFVQPYQSFDEQTGQVTDGVTSTIQDEDGSYYATSSKTVYHTLKSLMEAFGRPTDEDYTPIKVKVLGIKQKRGIQIDLELLDIEEDEA